MPTSISSATSNACDPNLASCIDSPPAELPPVKAATPSVVTIEPVVITGDAGAQALLRRYDAEQACLQEKDTAILSCAALVPGALSTLKDRVSGLAGSLLTSVVCGKELRALSDCREQAEARQSEAARVIDDCHARDGTVGPGACSSEIICEVER
jgi:hypothetical protein